MPWNVVIAIVRDVHARWNRPERLQLRKVPERTDVPRTLRQAIVEPFREFTSRRGWRYALLALAFMFFYKLGDSMATALARTSIWDLGSLSPPRSG
jgi:PAT family beta-lactamase induction signal transducer AmpG